MKWPNKEDYDQIPLEFNKIRKWYNELIVCNFLFYSLKTGQIHKDTNHLYISINV